MFAVLIVIPANAATPAGCDGAGNCYVRAGAAGAGNGSSWTNAYTGFGSGAGKVNPASMMRGVTYWVAAGNYGGVTFSTPDSGTSVITLESPTTSNHGPASDWNPSFAGQALFGESTISTDYWTFNGQTRGADWQSGYNLKFWNQSDASGAAILLNVANTSHITFQYVELEGTGAGFPNNNSTADKCTSNNCGVWADNAIYTGSNHTDNLYVGYSYAHHTGNTQFQMNGAVNNTATWEYSWVSYNHTGQNGQHDEAYSLYGSNITIRYNVFQNICSTAIITTAGGGNPSLSNWDIYGNLFFWDATYAAFNGQYQLGTIDNGIVDFLGETMSGYVHFYNNTIAGFNNSVATMNGSAFATNAVGGVGQGYNLGTPSISIYNNLWWNSALPTGDYSDYNPPGSSRTEDYDSFYQGSVPAAAWTYVTEAHGQVFANSTDPFVNSGANMIAGFALTTSAESAMSAGITLASPYDVDMLGVPRASNGKWDRGALQFGSFTGPQPPTGLAAVVH
jgi:hypothetical protein